MCIKPLRSHFYKLCIYLTIEQQEMPIMVMELPSLSHLAKPCHMLQRANVKPTKWNQKTPFSVAVLHDLSHGMVCFVLTVSFLKDVYEAIHACLVKHRNFIGLCGASKCGLMVPI